MLTSFKNFTLVISVSLGILSSSQLAKAEISASPTNKTLTSSKTRTTKQSSNNALHNKFNRFVDNYFDFCMKTNPNMATTLGIHKYDNLVPDLTISALNKEKESLKHFQLKLKEFSKAELNTKARIDLTLIENHINARLLELEEIKAWQKNPDEYSSQSYSLIYNLIVRDFASLRERFNSVILREKKIPEILESGKKNLESPPKIFTTIALEQLPGMIEFFEKSVPEKFKSVEDEKMQTEFRAVNSKVISSLKAYQQFLKDDLLNRSNGNFALGSILYQKKLAYEEMENTELDILLDIGEKELKRLQQQFLSLAKKIDPNVEALELFKKISSDHPAPDKLISSTAAMLKQLKEFCTQNKIVSWPHEDELAVTETPAAIRALTFAAMDGPGPFETKAKEAYYYVTLPEKDWKPERTEEHMRAFCKYDLINTSVHEAYPGHYVQGLWTRNAPSKTIKILYCSSNSEGWAHYCEQMMVEEGLFNNDPKLKLVMIHDALLRCARYIVGIRMHTKNMSLEEGTSFFVNEGYQEKANAEREAKRGTSDPTYLVYTLGKLQIIALKEEYKRLKGEKFNLQEFHDTFLSKGCIPINLLRKIILSESSNNTL